MRGGGFLGKADAHPSLHLFAVGVKRGNVELHRFVNHRYFVVCGSVCVCVCAPRLDGFRGPVDGQNARSVVLQAHGQIADQRSHLLCIASVNLRQAAGAHGKERVLQAVDSVQLQQLAKLIQRLDAVRRDDPGSRRSGRGALHGALVHDFVVCGSVCVCVCVCVPTFTAVAATKRM